MLRRTVHSRTLPRRTAGRILRGVGRAPLQSEPGQVILREITTGRQSDYHASCPSPPASYPLPIAVQTRPWYDGHRGGTTDDQPDVRQLGVQVW